MTDLMFEIAEYDDSDGQKAEYLNAAISTWKNKKSKKNNSTPYDKHCYHCNQVLTPNHKFDCPGKYSKCTHCDKIGHLKICCGQLGYFPHPPRKL